MKFKVSDLVVRIGDERAKHRKIFEEAVDNYKAQVLKELDSFAERVKNGERIRIISMLPVPEEHTEDFDMVLEMLKMTTNEEIELDEHQFNIYVRGKWDWMQSFVTNTVRYSK